MSSKEYEMKVVEKLIPSRSANWTYIKYVCPRCEVDLEYTVQSHYKCKYCPECGQKVWWY